MSSIDDRIVNMKFNNGQFMSSASETVSAIDKLKSALNFKGGKDGIDEIANSVKNFNLNPLDNAFDASTAKMVAFATAGITAVANLTNRVVNSAVQLGNSILVEPIRAGFAEYETKLGSIQTILANTQASGTTLDDVSASLSKLNTYADKTIYSFGDMTRNIGLFTNAGLGIEESTSMIKGFSNAAAASGTSAQGASGAAYQLSQALSSGTIRLMDWRSLTNAGMGNKNMQNGLIEIADAMGALNDKSITASEIQSDFNGSLEKNWLSADVMSKYLQIMAGDMDDASMAALGLSENQIEALKLQAATAEEAATKVRTWTQLIGTLQEAVGSGWGQTAEIIFGDFEQATELWTAVSDRLGEIVGDMSDARNDMLQAWSDGGGRDALLGGLLNIWNSIETVMKSVSDVVGEIIPSISADQLIAITKGFETLTSKIKMAVEQAANIAKVVSLILAPLEILKDVFRETFSFAIESIKEFIGIFPGMNLDLESIAEKAEELELAFKKWYSAGNYVSKFFDKLREYRDQILDPMARFVTRINDAFIKLFSGNSTTFLKDIMGAFTEFTPLLDTLFQKIQNVGAGLSALLNRGKEGAVNAKTAIGNLVAGLVTTIGTIRDGLEGIKTILTTGTFKGSSYMFGFAEDSGIVQFLQRVHEILSTVSDALFGVADEAGNVTQSGFGLANVAEIISTAWDGLLLNLKNVVNFFSPLFSFIGNFFKALSDKVVEWISDLKLEDAVALLNAGFFILLYKALTTFINKLKSVADGFGGFLENVSGSLDQLTKTLKTMQQEIRVKMVLEIAIAVAILAGSLWLLSTIEPARLAMALGGIAALFAGLALIMANFKNVIKDFGQLEGLNGKMLSMAASMVLLAIAISILAKAVSTLAQLDLPGLAKGLLGVSGLLGAMYALIKKNPEIKEKTLNALEKIKQLDSSWLKFQDKLGRLVNPDRKWLRHIAWDSTSK